MNDTTSTSGQSPATGWSLPVAHPDISGNRPGRSEQDLQRWIQLTAKVAEIGQLNGWSKSNVAQRIGMADGTFNQWFSGKYEGRLETQNEKVERWIASAEEMSGLAATVPVSPGLHP